MSSLIIDKKYVGFISSRLKNVTYKGAGNVLASFTHSCERSDSRKKRGHFLLYPDGVFMRCFNCSESLPLSKFIQDIDPSLYRGYCLENFKEGIWESKNDFKQPNPEPIKKEETTQTKNHFTDLISYASLPPGNPALKYISNRQIPEARYKELYLVPKFYKWASRIDPIFEKFKTDVPRLIIPCYDSSKKLLGFTCRAFGKELPKYIHLRIDKEQEFIYGQNHVDINKTLLVVEGQLDSLFLDNCLAIGRADYKSRFLETHKHNVIIIPDNDFRRNLHVCNQLKKAISNGFTICILPDSWKKDINDIVRSGITAREIEQYVFKNKKSGAAALLELALEKRC
jgi:hypothetical protein